MKKNSKNKIRRKIYLVILLLFLVVFLISSTMLGLTLYRYRQADVLYNDLQNRYVTFLPQQSPEQSTNSADPSAPDTSSPEPVEVVIAPIRVDFDALLQENGDVVGWLYCEDTPINYPVLRADDNDYYLHRDLNGKYLFSGSLFVDYRCPPIGMGQNFIIYGHNMKNGTMFAVLSKYKEQSYYDEHPVLWYLTPNGDYRIDLFAGMVTKSDSEVYTPNFGDEEAFGAFLQRTIESSTFVSDVSVTPEDHIVTLSTCSYEFGNARYVVLGKLIGSYPQN